MIVKSDCINYLKFIEYFNVWIKILQTILSYFSPGFFLCQNEATSRNNLYSISTSLKSDSSKNQELHACDICPYKTPHVTNLKRHYLIHTGQRPFVCNYCNKSFNQKVTLSVHLRLHTGEKPYPCDKCSENFISRAALRRHLASKHVN